MKTKFPASPYANHAFLPFPESGNLYTETSEQGWVVVLQRDGTIRGPMPALTYVPVQRGKPNDVIAYHMMNKDEGLKIWAKWTASGQITDVVSTRAGRMTGQVGVGLSFAIVAAVILVSMRKHKTPL